MESLQKLIIQINNQTLETDKKSENLKVQVSNLKVELDNMEHKVKERKYTLNLNNKKLEKLVKDYEILIRRKAELKEMQEIYKNMNEFQKKEYKKDETKYIKISKQNRQLEYDLDRLNKQEEHLINKKQKFCNLKRTLNDKIVFGKTQKQILNHNIEMMQDEMIQKERDELRETDKLSTLEQKFEKLTEKLKLVENYKLDREFEIKQNKNTLLNIEKNSKKLYQELDNFNGEINETNQMAQNIIYNH